VSAAGERRLVLIVEDDDDIRRSLGELLEDDGYQVITACDGREGLERLELGRPCLIVLDILMPRMNGLEFLAAVKADPERADIPIVAMTAGDGATEAGLTRAGAARLLTKPLKLDRLLAVVGELA
jgi:CheY-like chemotaxis protein